MLTHEATMAAALDGIDGWLHPAEAAVLYVAAMVAGVRSKAPLVVEIGAWQGRSTVAAALGLRDAGSGGRVVSIDPHMHPRGDDNLRALETNVRDRALEPFVETVRALSGDVAGRFDDGTIDVLFVDGDHELPGVRSDIDLYGPKLAPGAVVGFNDPWLPGVSQALQETVARAGSGFGDPRWVVNSLFFTSGASMDAREVARVRRFLRHGARYHRVTSRISNDRAGNGPGARLVRRVDGAVAHRYFRGLVGEPG